jgi:hypothetical protein
LCDVLNVARPEPAGQDDAQNAYVFERAVTFQNGDGTQSTAHSLEALGLQRRHMNKHRAEPSGAPETSYCHI